MLQALDGDTAKLDRLALSLGPGEGIGIKNGSLHRFTFVGILRPRPGYPVNWKEEISVGDI